MRRLLAAMTPPMTVVRTSQQTKMSSRETTSLPGRIADIYRRTSKPKDILWNRLVARPIAALVLAPLQHTRISPNQVTLASLVVFAGAAALMAFLPGHRGLLLAVAVLEFSYVLDCVDGQLARLRGTSTPVGAHLDFLMDELKAFLLVAAAGVRLWQGAGTNAGGESWLLEGLAALVAIASAISLSTFVRRPEYLAATGTAPGRTAGDYGAGFDGAASTTAPTERKRGPVQIVEAIGRYVIHYPSYLVFIAAADRLDIFLHAYLAVNTAHTGRSLLAIARRLGKFAR